MSSVSPRFLNRDDRYGFQHTLLSPANWQPDSRFEHVTTDEFEHMRLLEAVQRFRGEHYLNDGALTRENLTVDGRHKQAADSESWHLILQDADGDLVSCARYWPILNPTFDLTSVSRSALAQSEWRPHLMRVVEMSIRKAQARSAHFAELGGWCVAPSARKSTQAIRSVLLMYALGEVLGGTVGLSTATKRHSSSSILQRLGARVANIDGNELPSYYEPMFDCEMDLLEFDSESPAAIYRSGVDVFRSQILTKMRIISCVRKPDTNSESLANLLKALQPAPVAGRSASVASRYA